ncbi:hypothetical protein ElyMa_001846600 [Elysia marginata]|uniref:Uncharacterized protein n=1 Tax=Elysia marginata TaxID=1093978 RepID=A0AAV4EKU2_9GAST|nr:hypothetical protein ElyMa_001846600 [Elysia marginata]
MRMPTDQPAHRAYITPDTRAKDLEDARDEDGVIQWQIHSRATTRDSVKRPIWQLREDSTSPRHLTVQADGKSKVNTLLVSELMDFNDRAASVAVVCLHLAESRVTRPFTAA